MQGVGSIGIFGLLDWRNTPTEGVGTSPAQRLMGRRCKTLLPIAGTLLKPQCTPEEDARALVGRKKWQQYYYDRNAKPRKPITPGETVRLKKWTAGTCTQQVDSRSYIVKVGDSEYRRNHKQLIQGQEPPIYQKHRSEETPTPDLPDQTQEPSSQQPQYNVPTRPSSLRRSARQPKTPGWHSDYIKT